MHIFRHFSVNANTGDRRFYVWRCNTSEIEPEALADFRLNDSGDRLAVVGLTRGFCVRGRPRSVKPSVS